MSQIFPRHFDLVLRLGLIGCALGIAGLIAIWRLGIEPALGEPVEQPVPFSHKHHVGDVGLDCRYCHASVERSAYAGMPDTGTCMNCHSQLFTDAPLLAPVRDSQRERKPLRWNRVYRLPDFVFFNHSIHVAKGIGCVSCHGRVDRMPLMSRASALTMQWCLACHRNPRPALRPPDAIYAMDTPATTSATAAALARAYHLRNRRELTDCSTCHR